MTVDAAADVTVNLPVWFLANTPAVLFVVGNNKSRKPCSDGGAGHGHFGAAWFAVAADRHHPGARMHACLAAPQGHHPAALADRGGLVPAHGSAVAGVSRPVQAAGVTTPYQNTTLTTFCTCCTFSTLHAVVLHCVWYSARMTHHPCLVLWFLQ